MVSDAVAGNGFKRLLKAAIVTLVVALAIGFAVSPAYGATLVDSGFENGVDGAVLATPPWAVNGAPQHREYDNARAKTGSMSAWIQGPTTASNAGAYETATGGMTTNGSEMTFWIYLDTTNQSRLLDEYAPGVAAADRAFSLQFAANGSVNVLTDRAGNPNGYTTAAYTPVGTYAVGWTQFRIVYDFTAQTYQLSTRSAATDPWTQLKASAAVGYAIPMRGTNAITSTHGTLWRGLGSAQMWIDDLAFGTASYAITTSAGAGGSISPLGPQTVAWGTNSPAFTIAPAAGYKISDVLVDGVSAGAVSTYQFTDVRADHTIAATFAVDAPPSSDMPLITDCSRCHTAPHADFELACEECHDFADYHPPATASGVHLPADVTSCSPCHNSSLTLEHYGRKTTAGLDITCATCHESTDPNVILSVATLNSSCTGCHVLAGHASAHSFTSGSDLTASGDAGCTNSGSGCHGSDPTHGNFSAYHPNTGCTGGACHTSPSKAGYAGNGDCQTCHAGNFTNAPARASLATQHYNETTHTATGLSATVSSGGLASARCSDCHNPSPPSGAKGLAGQHTGITPVAGSPYGTTIACANCHDDTRVSGNAVVLANWPGTSCSACHSIASSAPQHSSTAPVVLTTSSEGCGASGTACHTTYDVHAIHKNAAGGCSLTGCHDYAKQGAKPVLKTCGETGGCHEGVMATHVAPPHDASGTDAGVPVTGGLACSTCHDLSVAATTSDTVGEHARPSSRTSSGSAIECGTCHSASYFPTGWMAGSPATNTCVSCHAIGKAPVPHAGALTAHDFTTITGNPDSCGSGSYCHNGPVGDLSDVSALHAASRPGDGSCTSCHSRSAVPVKRACGDCHAARTATHAARHDTSGSAGCLGCHPDMADLGGHASCATCHANATLTANGTRYLEGTYSADCASCHASLDHEAVHVTTLPPSCTASRCHSGTSLTTLHINAGTTLTCSTCHDSTDPLVAAAITGHNKACSACHSASDPHPGGAHLAQGSCALAGCHPTDVKLVHAPGPGCSACHADGTTPSFVCAKCHPSTQHSALHVSNEICNACHTVSNVMSAHGDKCETCHPTPASGLTWTGSCSQTGCHTAPHADALEHTTQHNTGQECWDCHGESWEGKCTTPACHGYNRVAPKTTSDAGGPYVGTATIHLSATAATGSTVYKTCYRVDGGTVQTGTTIVLSPPASGVATRTLEFWSLDTALNSEEHHLVDVRVIAAGTDTTAPTTSSNVVGSYLGTATITFSASDNPGGQGVKATYYMLDGAAPVKGTSVAVAPPAYGSQTHTLQFYSVDNALNSEAAKPAPAFRFTVTRPTATIRFAWDNPSPDSNAEVLIRDPSGHVYYHAVSPGWAPAGWFITAVPVNSRPYSLEAWWYDDDTGMSGHSYGSALVDTPGASVTWYY